MTITLKPEHEKLVAEALLSGAYSDTDDVIGHALEMLQAETESVQTENGLIEAKIERALQQFERGEFMSPEESQRDMELRKREWLAKQPV
jgi:Arc/MetJ-type ribon-helix-helix transcriptional regulator